MAGYVPRLSKTSPNDMSNNAWYYSKNPFYQAHYGLPNCTCYAWGRFAEILGDTPSLFTGNAEDWWDYNVENHIYECGVEPQLGAVLVLAGGNASGCGHVLVVEEINDSEVVFSQSGWQSDYFWVSKRPKSDFTKSNQGKVIYYGYVFKGFIYNPMGAKGSSSTIDMQQRASVLYSSETFAYENVVEPEETAQQKMYRKEVSAIRDYLSNVSFNPTTTNTAAIPEVLSSGGEIEESKKISNKRELASFDLSQECVEAPFVEVTFGNFVVGSYRNSADKWPNHISALNVKKINGEINQYQIGMTHQIRFGEDPNKVDKILSSIRYNKISIRYGDCMSGSIFRDNEAVITNVVADRDYIGNKISYTVYAISACNYVTSYKTNFPAVVDKPSNVIRKLLYNSGQTSILLQEAFPVMANKLYVESEGLIPNNDIILSIDAQINSNPLQYINYLVACMSSNSNASGSTIKNSTYYITYNDSSGGAYFEIKEVKSGHSTALTNSVYEVYVGYPDNNFIRNFTINNDTSWAMLYENGFVSSERVFSIDSNGNNQAIFSPNIMSTSKEMTEVQKNWWTQMTTFPISAELTLRGLLRPINLIDFINVHVVFYGQEHITSGTYVVTGQQDVLNGSGFVTKLGLTRVGD